MDLFFSLSLIFHLSIRHVSGRCHLHVHAVLPVLLLLLLHVFALGSSSLAVSAVVAHAHAPSLHDACSNSWSDTVRVKGPTGTSRVTGRVSVRP